MTGVPPADADERTPPPPIVSIITATYNRPHILRYAILSVLAQTFTDWELVIIGDGCSDETASVVSSFDDSRIRYFNLPINYGEQSGPNNVGVCRARGQYLAFLNHDDMWFPDHLAVTVGWLEATGADMVIAIGAIVLPLDGASRLPGRWAFTQTNPGRRGLFDPVRTVAPASTWLMTRRLAREVGPWRPARDLYGETSQDFLFRAWRRGFRLRVVPNLSVLILQSGRRRHSYRNTNVAEHDLLWGQLTQDPDDLRLAVADRLTQHASAIRRGRGARAGEWFLRALAHLGISPRELWFSGLMKRGRLVSPRQLWLNRPFKRGRLIAHLRSKRGLASLGPADLGPDQLRAQYRKRAPAYRLGTVVDLSARGLGYRIRGAGWSRPGGGGTWIRARSADLVFRLEQPAIGPLCLDVGIIRSKSDAELTREIQVEVKGRVVETWTLDRDSRRYRALLPEELVAGARTLRVVIGIGSPGQSGRRGADANASRHVGLRTAVLREAGEMPDAPEA